MIYPDELARAIWRQGQDFFEYVFFGKIGRSGAAAYWSNARERCSWYPRHIGEEWHTGLIPIALYGDEVHAYRNTDPGAVSAIGWTSEFSYGIDAILQYGLLAVYSEYTECEHTYSDLLESILPRFAHLCDAEVNHPWRHEFRFCLSGIRGDLKWINDKYKLHNYRTNSVCSRCSALKDSPNVLETITCFTCQAQHTQISHQQFCDERCVEDWPIPMRFGVFLERFCHDTCHSQLLGSGKILNGSILVFLAESAFWTAGNGFHNGPYGKSLQLQLQRAFLDYKSWSKSHHLGCNQPRFTCNRLNRKHRGMQPCFLAICCSML